MRVYNLNQSSDIIYILNILRNSFRSVVKLGIHRAVGITYLILFYINLSAPNVLSECVCVCMCIMHIVMPKKLNYVFISGFIWRTYAAPV